MQHQTALDDWNRQNEYNSPAAQMGRNKDAGLNPNLIYGNMTNSAPIKTGDVTTPQMQAPRSQGLSNAILMKQQLVQSNAQTQLLAQQANAAAEDAALKRAQTANITADTTLKGATTENTQFNTSQNRLMSPGSLEQQQVTNAKLRADINRVQAETGSILNATDISRIMLEPNKARVIQEILNLKAQTAKSYAEQNLIQSTIQSNDVQNALHRIETEERTYNLNTLKSGNPTGHDAYFYRFGKAALDKVILP